MVPFVPYAKRGPVVIGEQQVMFQLEPADELKRQVIEATSGIALPDSGGLKLV